jgi:hypothetical protein
MEISKIYTKEGSVELIEIDSVLWVKGRAILIRIYYVYEDEWVILVMEFLYRN